MSDAKPDIRAIFCEALDQKTPEEIAEYLDVACGDDADLRSKVEALIGSHREAGNFLGGPQTGGAPTLDQSITERPGTVIGPYKLLQEIGQGGMGVVYMSEQTEPVERRVALKIIKPGMDTRQVIARFEAERQALAMMDHPNIAKVLDAGTTDSGRPYFVMELVKGTPITEYCDEHHLSPGQRLELFVPVCQAVQHAHQKGIIHRDIKPSNVLVCNYDDRPMPKIIDFGVAKAVEHRLTEKTMFTEFGQVVGTPEYMSPEQARLSQLDIDTRSDIYSLGVLLYELLVGETPFDRQRLRSAAFDELLRIIREEEPPRPSIRLSTSETLPSIAANRQVEPKKLSTLVRGELDWIVMKAMEKDRTRRYETANGFAADIKRYLDDERVEACPPSAGYRFRKFARRNKVVIAVVSAAVLILVSVTIGALIAADAFRDLALRNADLAEEKQAALSAETAARLEATESLRVAEEARAQEVTARQESVYHLYLAEIQLAHSNWKTGQLADMQRTLDKHIPMPGEQDLRGWEWYYLRSLIHQDKMTLRGHTGVVAAVAWSHDGTKIISGDWSGAIKVWDAATGKEIVQIQASSPTIVDLGWSHDDRMIAACADDTVDVWDAATWEILASLTGYGQGRKSLPVVTELAWSPNDRQLAYKSGRRQITIWDAETRKPLQTIETDHGVASIVWDQTGERLAAGFSTPANGLVVIWNARTGQREHEIDTQLINIIGAVAFSPDNELLATGNDKGSVKIWKWATGEEQHVLEHNGAADAVAWSPSGRHLAVGSRGQQIKIWNVADGTLAETLQGHTSHVPSVAWSPDGELLASAGCWDGTAKIWDVDLDDPDKRRFIKSSPSGRQSLYRQVGGTMVICETATDREICEIPEDADPGNRSLWSPDEQLLGVRLPDKVSIHDAESGHPISQLSRARYAVWSPNSQMLACYEKETTDLFVCEARSGQELFRISIGENPWEGYKWSHDSRFLAFIRDQNRTGVVWNVARNAEELRIEGDDMRNLAFSPNNRYIAFSDDRVLRIWDVVTRQQAHELPHRLGNWCPVAWGPESSLVAFGGVNSLVDVWDLKNTTKRPTLRGHTGMISGIAFFPDGRRIATSAQDKTTRIWDAYSGRQVLLIQWPFSTMVREWNRDGKQLILQGGGDWRTIFLDATRGYEQPEAKQ